MRNKWNNIALCLMALLTISCGLDNYDAPQSKLHGQIIYKAADGTEYPLQVKGTGEAIRLSLYQYGYQLKDNIPVFTDQDATFEAVLFDGEYHLILNKDNGPWKPVMVSEEKKDTVDFYLKKSTQIKVYVTPYFLIRNAVIGLENNLLSGSCEVDRIIENAKISNQCLFVSTTHFVDESSNFIRMDLPGDKEAGKKDFSLTVTDEKQLKKLEEAKNRAGKVFVRLGIKAEGSDQFLYSDIKEIALR
ncbi:MAG: DUF3823 domain-containing protein [Bacteroidales bacterium]